jgi:hypothetical protein
VPSRVLERSRSDIGGVEPRQEFRGGLNWDAFHTERTNVYLPISTDFRVVRPDHVVTRLVDGMTVLLDVDSGRTFSLDDIGTRAWQVLIEAPTVQAAVEQLQREYDAEPGELERDLLALIDRLVSAQLLQLQGRQP